MRIVGGRLGGRRFQPPANIPARPTTDMAREGLFNILGNRVDFEGIKALELFAGTGAVAFEIASRSEAAQVTLVEQDAALVAFIKSAATAFGIAAQLQVLRAEAFRFLEKCSDAFDLIFADPPYALPQLSRVPELIFSNNLLKDGGFFILEHDARHSFQQHAHFRQERRYGDALFSFFEREL